MKNNKRLSLKQLQAELELLKTIKSNTIPATKTPTSGVIFLANKIPMIKGIIGMLSLWYGRTTRWKMLYRIFILSRKLFIIFNALIGMYVVFKLSGFQVGLMWSFLGVMGHTYMELLYGFAKRLFEWFLDFLGYDIGPKKPNIFIFYKSHKKIMVSKRITNR